MDQFAPNRVDQFAPITVDHFGAIFPTIFHTYFDYITEWHSFDDILNDLDENLSTDVYDVYRINCSADPTYSTDTLVIPTRRNSCFPPDVRENDSISTTHRKLKIDALPVWEIIDNSVFNGAIIAQMEYFPPASAANQTNVLKQHKVFVGSTSPSNLRRFAQVAALENGKAPKTLRHYLTDTQYGETSLAYSNKGNILSITAPRNHQSGNQRLKTSFIYDGVVEQFIEGVANSYGDSICNSYQYATGLLDMTVDPNGHATQYEYDDFYRPLRIWAPRELEINNSGATMEFKYHPFGLNPTSTSFYDRIPVAFTVHNMARNLPVASEVISIDCGQFKDLSSRPSIEDSLRTATFMDGAGKVIQIKKDAIKDSTVTAVVSGFTALDHLGRSVATRNSFLDSQNPLGILSLPTSAVDKEIISYVEKFDYMNRPLTTKVITDISNYFTPTNYNYTWKQVNSKWVYAEDVVTEASSTTSFKDSWGRVVMTTAYGDTTHQITTQFEYNALGELISSTNPLGVVTSYLYDLFGRVVQESHDDRGISRFEYDYAGNLHKIRNAATGMDTAIVMNYQYNRLIEKIMPETNGLYGVNYSYGTLGDGLNGAGRIVQIQQGVDFKTDVFAYDELGNLVVENKTITLETGPGLNYETSYKYDSWGKILEAKYPDNEIVRYFYNPVGDLQKINSKLASETAYIDILDHVNYDGFGNMSKMKYGNDAVTRFSYNPYTRRLFNFELNTRTNATNAQVRHNILDKTYTYDPIGRVIGVENDQSVWSNPNLISGMGGSYSMHYGYDAFNRLDSTWGTHSHDTATYSLGMSYNDAGGILTKDQTGTGFNSELNYNFDYIYDNQDGSTPTHKKHRLNKVIDSPPYTNSTPFGTEFAYNKAGSLRAVATQINPSMPIDTVERFVYNEEQWLMGYQSTKAGAPQTFTHFAYDHTGERILKGGFTVSQLATNGQSRPLSLAMDPYTVYVNPYYVVEHYSSADHISKHYYMGTQRIATTVGYTPDTTYNTLRMADSALPSRTGALADNAAWILGQMGLDASQYTQAPAPEYDDFHGEGAADAPENAEDPIGNDPPLLRVTYYYHPDYLGNIEYITDMNGLPYQYFWYSPWGESLKEHAAASSWDSPYRFNGKELDEESGLYYYGARYYNPKVSVWLGVDPLAAKFPSYSSYSFVLGNPLNFVDPTGLEPVLPGEDEIRLPDNPKDLDEKTWIKQRPNGLPEGEGHSVYYKHKSSDIWLAYDEAKSNKTKSNKAHYHLYKGDGSGGILKQRFDAEGNLLPKNKFDSKAAHLNPGVSLRISRAIANLSSTCFIIFDITAILTDSPQNPLYMIHQPGDGEPNRAYLDFQTGLIYEWRNLSDDVRQVDYFRDYDFIGGEWRGVDNYKSDFFGKDGRKLQFDEL